MRCAQRSRTNSDKKRLFTCSARKSIRATSKGDSPSIRMHLKHDVAQSALNELTRIETKSQLNKQSMRERTQKTVANKNNRQYDRSSVLSAAALCVCVCVCVLNGTGVVPAQRNITREIRLNAAKHTINAAIREYCKMVSTMLFGILVWPLGFFGDFTEKTICGIILSRTLRLHGRTSDRAHTLLE